MAIFFTTPLESRKNFLDFYNTNNACTEIEKCFWLLGTSPPSILQKLKIIVLSVKKYKNKLGHSQ
jgi:hypothetical protein